MNNSTLDQNTVVAALGQGYVDPNRKEQSRSICLPIVGAMITHPLPTVLESGEIHFDPNSMSSEMILSSKINPIEFAHHLKEIQMQAEALNPEIEPSTGTLTFDESGNVSGLGLGVDKTVRIELDPEDPDKEGTIEGIQKLFLEQDEQIKLRGETPVIAHIDELPYYATDKQGAEGEAGPVGQPGVKGDDDSALAKDHVSHMGIGANKRARRRKKSKPKSKHLPNMKSKVVKAALGAAILTKLGMVQRDTADAVKRDVLKDLPLSGFVEAVTGKTLPDYQKRLLDLQQARAEGTLKPELESLGTKAPSLEPVQTEEAA